MKIQVLKQNSMKLINEHLNFQRGSSDSKLSSLGIGRKKLIEEWLEKYNIRKYYINDDYSIGVTSNVYLEKRSIGNLPEYIQFDIVDGNFRIDDNNLTTLRGCPRCVNDIFDCEGNNITSLEFAPKYIKREFYCRHTSLSKEVIKDYIDSISFTGELHTDFIELE